MDVTIYYFGTDGPFHASKPLWLRHADVVLEAPTRVNLVDAIRTAATQLGINVPISENMATLVWTGNGGRVNIIGGPQPVPAEEPAVRRQSVVRRIPIHLSVPVGPSWAMQQVTMQPQPQPAWWGAVYVNGQNYVGGFYGGGVPVPRNNGPLGVVYQDGRNYVGDFCGTGAWQGPVVVQQPVLAQGFVNVATEMVQEAEVPAGPERRAARAEVEPARVEVAGEVRRERLTEMREDALGHMGYVSGMGVLELHALVDVDGVEWGGVVPGVRSGQQEREGQGGGEAGGNDDGDGPAVAA